MKRYFDIGKNRITLELKPNEEGRDYWVKEIEDALVRRGLRKVNKRELDRPKYIYINLK